MKTIIRKHYNSCPGFACLHCKFPRYKELWEWSCCHWKNQTKNFIFLKPIAMRTLASHAPSPRCPKSPNFLHDTTLDYLSHFFMIPLRSCKVTLKQQKQCSSCFKELVTPFNGASKFHILAAQQTEMMLESGSVPLTTHQNPAAIMYRESKPFTFLAPWMIWMGWMGVITMGGWILHGPTYKLTSFSNLPSL